MSSSPKMPPGEQSSTGVPASKNPLKEHTPTPDLRVPFGSTSMPAKQNHIQMHDPRRVPFSSWLIITVCLVLFFSAVVLVFMSTGHREKNRATSNMDTNRW